MLRYAISRRVRAAAREPRVAAKLLEVRLRLWLDPKAAVRAPVPRTGRRHDDVVEPIARSVRRWSRVVPRSTCLVQAIAAAELLAAKGIPSTILFGTTRSGSGLEAHAWLTVDDRVVLGRGPGDHVVLGAPSARYAR